MKLFGRFGQNERSLFSFLLSEEPFSLREFCSQPAAAESFYRLHHLYDYGALHLVIVSRFRAIEVTGTKLNRSLRAFVPPMKQNWSC